MASVYIHIPFCKSICAYCDFTKILYNKNLVNSYLDALKNEIDDFYEKEKVDTLYIGGGTPSCLSLEELDKLRVITDSFNFSHNLEFTFECNIEDISYDLLLKLKELGVNRLSIGIESFNKCKLEFMNRKADYKSALEKINLARNLGFNNINLDLMYGIPGERLTDLKKDLKEILKLEPEHISTYSLIIEDNTMCKIRNDENIDEIEEVRMYEYIVSKLNRKGYIHYEVSNFAKPGFKSLHNLTYWNNEEYYGFGLGASGYIKGFRYENTKNIEKYNSNEYKKSENLVSNQEKMDNEIMLGLRKMEGISLQEFFDKYGVNMQDVYPITPLVKNRELIYKNGYISINPKYIYVMNEILLKLI